MAKKSSGLAARWWGLLHLLTWFSQPESAADAVQHHARRGRQRRSGRSSTFVTRSRAYAQAQVHPDQPVVAGRERELPVSRDSGSLRTGQNTPESVTFRPQRDGRT